MDQLLAVLLSCAAIVVGSCAPLGSRKRLGVGLSLWALGSAAAIASLLLFRVSDNTHFWIWVTGIFVSSLAILSQVVLAWRQKIRSVQT